MNYYYYYLLELRRPVPFGNNNLETQLFTKIIILDYYILPNFYKVLNTYR